jgi:hypothetical protein
MISNPGPKIDTKLALVDDKELELAWSRIDLAENRLVSSQVRLGN